LSRPVPLRGAGPAGAGDTRPDGAAPAYRPPWWLPGAHLQTIVPARVLAVPRVAYARERWDTPDGDFIDVDFALPQPADARAPLLVLFHGLEGDSSSHYARLVMDACARRGWRGLVVHFRGCSGEANRLPRAYHSGDTAEVDWILERIAVRWPQARRFAVGVSLGGNVLAKWAGEQGPAAARRVVALATVSAPFDLVAGGQALGEGFNRVYTAMFLRTLRPKALAKVARFPGLADAARIGASRSIREFDDAFTAPVHGFDGVLDYWRRASAKPWLATVALPMLALNARNDPFVPGRSLPTAAEVSRFVTLDSPAQGGHVGFGGRGPAGHAGYLAQRVTAFLGELL
jgi:predicted alpha/beta-fold hydrolase